MVVAAAMMIWEGREEGGKVEGTEGGEGGDTEADGDEERVSWSYCPNTVSWLAMGGLDLALGGLSKGIHGRHFQCTIFCKHFLSQPWLPSLITG